MAQLQDQCPKEPQQHSQLTLREKREETCTYQLDAPKAPGRAVWDGSQQEAPGCREQLQGILHDTGETHGGKTSPSARSLLLKGSRSHSPTAQAVTAQRAGRCWGFGDGEPAQAPSALQGKVGTRGMLQILLQGKS